jgi:hypothetical protein
VNWGISVLGVYVLRCASCGRRTLRFGYGSALSTCYHHDDHCPVQIAERLGAPSVVDQLVDAWRTADDRYGRLNGRWPLVRLVMWPAALVAVALLVTDSSGLAPVMLTLAGLLVAGVHIERMHRADVALAQAWDRLADHTGLPDEELVYLVRDDAEEAE